MAARRTWFTGTPKPERFVGAVDMVVTPSMGAGHDRDSNPGSYG